MTQLTGQMRRIMSEDLSNAFRRLNKLYPQLEGYEYVKLINMACTDIEVDRTLARQNYGKG